MPRAADCWLDDSLAQHIIDFASVEGCTKLAGSCRRFCSLVGAAATAASCLPSDSQGLGDSPVTTSCHLQVRSTRTFSLCLKEWTTSPEQLAELPAGRTYTRVDHISFDGAAGEAVMPLICNSCYGLCCGHVYTHVQRLCSQPVFCAEPAQLCRKYPTKPLFGSGFHMPLKGLPADSSEHANMSCPRYTKHCREILY
jgi:hypothetical protein